jgi:hypothetical protein
MSEHILEPAARELAEAVTASILEAVGTVTA